MHRFRFPLFLIFFTAATVAQAAQDVRYYDVETIIFESLDPSARQSENWKTDINRQVPKVAAELDQPYPGPIPSQYDPKLTFKTLPSSQFQLQTEQRLLTATHRYRILLHTAWVQPGMAPNVALPVHITRSFLSESPVSHSLIPVDPAMPASNLPSPNTPTETRSVLDGYIKIILTRYLHADVDLVYTTQLPVNPQSNVTSLANQTSPQATTGEQTGTTGMQTPIIYRLKESRRMRSKELHYLDHPVLGMLLLITQHETQASLNKSR